MRQNKRVLDKVPDFVKDCLVAYFACHILYMPFGRFIMMLACIFTGVPREELEKTYNTVVIFVFWNRGRKFLERTGRLQKYGNYYDVKKKNPFEMPAHVKEALQGLNSAPSDSLRTAIEQGMRYPLFGDVKGIGLLNPPTAGNSEDLKDWADIKDPDARQLIVRSTSTARLAAEVFQREKRITPVSYVVRRQIAEEIGSKFRLPPQMTERISFLPQESRVSIFMLVWLSVMEGSPIVLDEAIRSDVLLLEHWIELHLKKICTKSRTPPEEILDSEALMVAKVLVSTCFRNIPSVRSSAHVAVETLLALVSNFERRFCKDSSMERVRAILELPFKFEYVGHDHSKVFGIEEAGIIGGHLPFEHDLNAGSTTVILDPLKHYLQSEIDRAACYTVLRFPFMETLRIVQGSLSKGVPTALFSTTMSDFYESRLVRGEKVIYNLQNHFLRVADMSTF